MARKASKFPTELELEILKIIWRGGPCAVRDVRESLTPGRRRAYTSVMTTMNIMVDKSYLQREKDGSAYVYAAAVTRENTLGQMLGDLKDRAFEGSTMALMVSLLEQSDVDPGELKELRQFINRRMKEQAS